jgi:hypothetical protein
LHAIETYSREIKTIPRLSTYEESYIETLRSHISEASKSIDIIRIEDVEEDEPRIDGIKINWIPRLFEEVIDIRNYEFQCMLPAKTVILTNHPNATAAIDYMLRVRLSIRHSL